ncbi:MAG TPA: PQ-loop domain-containing transporter [Candidatus Saccharimonadales bacterium]|nr:PQ-loop domain-containing transporter [Candidatus Saccharimonadales bacterium]
MSFHLFKHAFSKSEKTTIDRAMTMVAVIHPLSALPQVIEIFASKNATGVSLATWLLFMLIGIIFMLYAIAHRIKPMIINQFIWFVMDFLIVTGVLIYG